MALILLIPAIVSLLLLAAHGMRLDQPILMVLPLAILVLLVLPRSWVARVTQWALVLGALEWIRVTLVYVSARQDLGMPWMRLAIILSAVALFTGLSSLVFLTPRVRRRYRLEHDPLLQSSRIDQV